jgi:hypothetical protein
VDWIGLAQERNTWRALVTLVLSLRVSWNAGKLSSVLTCSGLSNSAQLHRVSWLVRNNTDLHYPQFHLSVYQKGEHYTGIKVFNRLPVPIKQLSHDKKRFLLWKVFCISILLTRMNISNTIHFKF